MRRRSAWRLSGHEILDAVLKQAGDPASGIQPEGIIGRQPSSGRRKMSPPRSSSWPTPATRTAQASQQITLTYNTSAELALLAEYLSAAPEGRRLASP